MIRKRSAVILRAWCLCREQLCRCEVKQAGRLGCVVDAGDGGRRRGKGKADLSTCCHFPSLMVEMMVSTEVYY